MLTDAAIRRLPPKEKRYVVADDKGLYLEVRPNGGKSWKVRLYQDGRERKTTLGRYPRMSLKEARLERDRLKIEAAEGGVRSGKDGVRQSRGTFEQLCREWFETKIEPLMSARHSQTVLSRLDRIVIPALGDWTPDEITAPDVLEAMRPVERMGHNETAIRTTQIIGQVMRYGVATGKCTRDVTADMKGALTPQKVEHRPTITSPAAIGALCRAIDAAKGTPIVQAALLFHMLTAVRPGELRKAEWAEIEGDLWKIPAPKMKLRRPHVVPLSRQALEVLEKLHPITGRSPYLFPAVRNFSRPMSDMTELVALRRLGYGQDEIVPHGFRGMFSTLAYENGWSSDVVERQLAHAKGGVRAAYDHSLLLDQRRDLMQWWADWLDSRRKESFL